MYASVRSIFGITAGRFHVLVENCGAVMRGEELFGIGPCLMKATNLCGMCGKTIEIDAKI